MSTRSPLTEGEDGDDDLGDVRLKTCFMSDPFRQVRNPSDDPGGQAPPHPGPRTRNWSLCDLGQSPASPGCFPVESMAGSLPLGLLEGDLLSRMRAPADVQGLLPSLPGPAPLGFCGGVLA